MAQGRLEKYLGANQSINKIFFLMYNVFSGAFECVRPSDRFCPSVRQMSVRPTDVRPSDRCLSIRQMSVRLTDVRPSDRCPFV